ncbi:MAG: 16S rRNA (guanine(527)-N(7))-methyltransferase RsmG [Aureliella sp.]
MTVPSNEPENLPGDPNASDLNAGEPNSGVPTGSVPVDDSAPIGESDSLGESDEANEDEARQAEAPESQSLAEAASRLGMDISSDKLEKLDEYCHRLWALNQQINLTRHTTYDLFARRDLLDSYHLASFLGQGEEILDVGTGGGVPGIPLAILRPDLKVSLCDSVGKKARAADQLVEELKLPIYVHAARVQDVLEEHTFDTLVTRAAGSITQLCNWLNNYWHCFNRLLAIKGPRWVEERGEARHRGVLHGIRLRRIHGYKMPGTKSESVILQMERPRPGATSGQ